MYSTGQSSKNKQQQHQQHQQQKQIYAQQEQEIQRQEMVYMMQQDLENMVGVIADTQATFEFFRHNHEHQYVKIAQNRLALQTNLSNGIISDLEQQKPEFREYLQNLKKQILQKFTSLNLQLDKEVDDAAIHYCQKNLASFTNVQQMQQKPVDIKPQFNQRVVEKVLGGIQQVDQKMDNIRNGERIDDLDVRKLRSHYDNRYNNAQQKLKQNYSDEYQKRIQYQQELDFQKKNGSYGEQNNQHQSKDPNQRRSQEPHQNGNGNMEDQNRQDNRFQNDGTQSNNKGNGGMEVETDKNSQNFQQSSIKPQEQQNSENQKKYEAYEAQKNENNKNPSQIKGQNSGQTNQPKQNSTIKNVPRR